MCDLECWRISSYGLFKFHWFLDHSRRRALDFESVELLLGCRFFRGTSFLHSGCLVHRLRCRN